MKAAFVNTRCCEAQQLRLMYTLSWVPVWKACKLNTAGSSLMKAVTPFSAMLPVHESESLEPPLISNSYY